MPQSMVAGVTGRDSSIREETGGAGAVLCVANFPSNTGYAWDFIETLYARLADRLAAHGARTWVAYPVVDRPPHTLEGSAARAVELDVDFRRWRGIRATIAFVRKEDVKVVYFADRAAWHPAYLLLRLAGVRRLVVHDHTSGARTVPRGIKRLLKLTTRRLARPMLADVVIGVSDFVVRRKVEVDLVPAQRVHRVWNSIDMKERDAHAAERLRDVFDLPRETMVVICACRASREKGVEHLLRAFDRLDAHIVSRTALVYLGDGPDIARLRAIVETLGNRQCIRFGGFRADAADLVEGADVCVVPSVWAEAFGLSALEPMARGVAVIASQVGGIPEVVVDGETGLLVAPGDEGALAHALARLLANPDERARLGSNGRRRAQQHFSMAGVIEQLARFVEPGIASRGSQ